MKNGAYLRLTASVIFVALGLWLGAKIFLDGSAAQQSVTAEFVSITEEISLKGVIIREEKTVCAGGDYLTLADDGQWLGGGDAVAVSRDAAKAYFDYLGDRESCSAAGEVADLFCALSVSKNREEQRLASVALSALLFGKEEEENEHIPLPRETVYAPFPGYFSRYCDGYEGLSPTEDFSSADAELPEDCLGKIVSGTGWYFAAETNGETAEKIRRCSSIRLDGYPAAVTEIIGGKIVFRVKSGVEAHLTDREKELTLSLCEYEGIRLPVSAVNRSEDGALIRIIRTGETEELPVEIIYGTEDFFIVRGEGLVPGMQVLSVH